MSKLDKGILSNLQMAVKAVVTSDNAKLKAEANTTVKTESIVAVAITIGNLDNWDLYRAELDRLARVNKTQRRVLGYEQIKVERKGAETLVTRPRQTLANIFSVLRQSFALAVPLVDGRGEPRPFNAIKADKVKTAAKVKAAKADDRTKDIHAIETAFKSCITNLKNVKDPADVAAIRARVEAEVIPMFPTATAK